MVIFLTHHIYHALKCRSPEIFIIRCINNGPYVLDIGGGLPSESMQDETKMKAYGSVVTEVFKECSFTLVTEFGQWVHAEAGFALSRIEYKLEPNRLFIHLGADFFMRDAYTKPRSFPLSVWNNSGEEYRGEKEAFDLAGPLCFAGDYLAHGALIDVCVQEGDYLVIDHTGANTYGLWSRHCSRSVNYCSTHHLTQVARSRC